MGYFLLLYTETSKKKLLYFCHMGIYFKISATKKNSVNLKQQYMLYITFRETEADKYYKLTL
jgi:hypothetical protein